MTRRISLLTVVVLMLAAGAGATTFIVREDAQMISSSDAIVHGIVVGARVDESGDFIQTIYDLRVLRVIKGEVTPGQTIQVSSPGGVGTKRFTYVASAAHFAMDQEVVLLLLRHKGAWAPSDMALSKFTFAVSDRGRNLLVRDSEEIVGIDGKGRRYVEKV